MTHDAKTHSDETHEAGHSANHDLTSQTSMSIDWYHEGESRSVDFDDVRVTIKLIGRKGRRARIAIEAPAGAVFRSLETNASNAAGAPLRVDLR